MVDDIGYLSIEWSLQRVEVTIDNLVLAILCLSLVEDQSQNLYVSLWHTI